MQIDWNLMAAWVQAVGNTVVLFMIYFQMRQVRMQMSQSDEQERFRRSWEFVRLYRDELREEDAALAVTLEDFDPQSSEPGCDAFEHHIKYFYKPRCHLFVLLNQLVRHQEVNERILFGYLEGEFNRFVELGICQFGRAEFTRTMGEKIDLLLTLWGSQIKAHKLLYG